MRKYVLLFAFAAFGFLGAVEVNPWDFTSGNGRFGAAVRIDSTQEITEDLLAGAAFVEVRADAEEDATLFGAHVRMLADVEGDLLAAGAAVEVNGEIKGKASLAGASLILEGTFADSLSAQGAVIFLKGHVKGPLKLSAAEVYIEDGTLIEDTLRYTAGRLIISEGAVLESGTREIIPEPKEEPEVEKKKPKKTFGGWVLKTILAFLFVAGAGIFLTLVFPRHFKAVTGRITVNPGLSALTGGVAFLASPLVVFAVVLLFISIVGIPAALVLSALYLIGILFSVVYAGTAFGRWILSTASKGKEPHLILSMLLGTFIAVVLCRIPYAGWLFKIGAFIFGFGAFLISTWLEVKKR